MIILNMIDGIFLEAQLNLLYEFFINNEHRINKPFHKHSFSHDPWSVIHFFI